jgi:hypothetical protein
MQDKVFFIGMETTDGAKEKIVFHDVEEKDFVKIIQDVCKFLEENFGTKKYNKVSVSSACASTASHAYVSEEGMRDMSEPSKMQNS